LKQVQIYLGGKLEVCTSEQRLLVEEPVKTYRQFIESTTCLLSDRSRTQHASNM
jgi:hypothetical protein